MHPGFAAGAEAIVRPRTIGAVTASVVRQNDWIQIEPSAKTMIVGVCFRSLSAKAVFAFVNSDAILEKLVPVQGVPAVFFSVQQCDYRRLVMLKMAEKFGRSRNMLKHQIGAVDAYTDPGDLCLVESLECAENRSWFQYR
jgi:hypothetical protein